MSVPAAFLTLVLIWSTTPLAVKWSGEGPGYLVGALGRMGLATALCLALVVALRQELPWHRDARRAYLSGALGAFGGMLLIYWAAQYVPSGLISVLFGLVPLVTALLAQPLLGERSLTPMRVVGMVVGLAGLATIFGASLHLGPRAPAGLAALCAAVLLQSLSLVLSKRYHGGLSSLSVTTGALMITTPLFLLTWLALGHHAPAQWPARAVASMVYLGVIGSVLGYTLFFYVLKRVSAHTSSLVTLITPVMALQVGAIINHEPIGARVWAGTALVLAGLAMHQWGNRLDRWLPVRSLDR
jgi:drug/metabolite transporter (DMT)-like permease